MDRAALFVLLALLCCARGQLVGISLQQQVADTHIGTLSCDTIQGFFTISMFNGFTEDRNFFALGQTSGVGQVLTATPLVVTIPARTSGELFLYGPSTSGQGTRSIVGRQTHIQIFMMDPDAQSNQLVGNEVQVCGGNFSNQCDCGFWNIPCMLDDCSPETFAFFWICLDAGIALIVSLIGLFFASDAGVRIGKMFHHFHATMTKNQKTPDQSYEAHYRAELKSGRMTYDQANEEMAMLKGRVESPEALNRIHELEDMAKRQAMMASNAAYEDEFTSGTLGNDDRATNVHSNSFIIRVDAHSVPLLPVHTAVSGGGMRMRSNASDLRNY